MQSRSHSKAMAMSASALRAQQAEADKKLPTIKLMLLGDSGVGKSSIMNRFTDNSFAESALNV
jgi:GTPase SAR1 family protein